MAANATLTALMEDVYKITKRPDLTGRTELAVRAATLKAHQSDFYAKDLFESGVMFDSEEYLQSLEYRNIVPRYRALKYIRKSDVDGEEGDFLEVITPDHILDSYYVMRTNVVYLAGDYLQLKSSTELQYILFGCYLNPNVIPAEYASWVATDHPFLIIQDAASLVFKGIGFDEQAATFQKLVADQYAELKLEIATQGY